MSRGKSDRKKQTDAYKKRQEAQEQSATARKQREAERIASSWVSQVRFQEDYRVLLEEGATTVKHGAMTTAAATTTISASTNESSFCTIVSWNILAENYCSPRSQTNLPDRAQHQVFHTKRRRQHLQRTLALLVNSNNNTNTNNAQNTPTNESSTRSTSGGVVDVVCLQEVDRAEIALTLKELGYGKFVASPTVDRGGGAGGKVDAVAVFVKDEYWTIQDELLVRFDDLAHFRENGSTTNSTSLSRNPLQGITHSFLRRNVAVLVRLRHRETGRTIVVANAHLFWNPSFEYVKLCQAHYLLLKAREFKKDHSEPFILAGDLNSRPNGVTHTYLVRGWIDARMVAPWCTNSKDSCTTQLPHNDGLLPLTQHLAGLSLSGNDHKDDMPPPRYLLDATLNKLCRWMRILGLDVALETDVEEAKRTGKGEMVLFDRCIKDSRTLISTSRRLVARRDCPCDTYFISAPFLATNETLETALVHLLLTHNVVLDARIFLTRCIVCNGHIIEVHGNDEKRMILDEYEAPPSLIEDGLAVYKCDTCSQGYWWNDMPTSSASRVKSTATHLLERCIRAGVKLNPNLGEVFSDVDVDKLRKAGWDGPNELLSEHHNISAVDWLKCARLENPLRLRSVYENIPFTNVTDDFVDTLDYILFEATNLRVTGKLYVPTSFDELSDGSSEQNAHLLPSDVWPSDHLAIGARFDILQRCSCGCVPNIPGLFEMAARRKEYQKKKAAT